MGTVFRLVKAIDRFGDSWQWDRNGIGRDVI